MTDALLVGLADVTSDLEAARRDPLSHWHIAVPRIQAALSLFAADDPIDELHLRACNKGGKTETVAAFVIACLQKRAHLDGVALPQWRGPVEAAQLVLDFKVQLLSVQPAYLRVLGKWPHHARYTGEILSSLHVQPLGGSDDETTWSVVRFLSQENRRSGVGVRADIAAFDEPPVMEILRELRKAAHAGRRGIIVIGETPTIRSQWAPLREDYGDTPRRTLRRVDRERAECRWSLDEVDDAVLTPAEKAKMLRRYAQDPLHGASESAREHGDYMATEGACPFHVPALLDLLSRCRDPELVSWRVSREADENGQATVVTVPVEVWEKPAKGKTYYVAIDPASGVDDNSHNPAGMLGFEIGSGDLVFRWNGYLAPYSLGVLAAGWARQYQDAAVDVEMKDHWGVNVIRGLQASQYGHLCYEQRELRPGQWAKEVGFDNNEEVRATLIGCVQEWLEAWSAGVRYAATPSRKVIECLLDCRLDERGKIVAGPGIGHGEDLVLRGQGLRRAVTRSGRMIPEIFKAPPSRLAKLAALVRGEGEDEDAPFGERVVVAPKRPSI